MKKSDIQKMSLEELKAKLQELRKDLTKARVLILTSQNKNLIKNLRRDIARVLTQINLLKKKESLEQ
ncbi:MAG: 50S ribosomal protein L29 [Candidatus Woesearchaeota archaeon]